MEQNNFTIDDTLRIIDLGYVIEHSCPQSLEDFMVKEFGNFDLFIVLNELEKSFSPTTTLPLVRKIIYDDQPPILQISYRNKFSEVDEALVFERKFSKTKAGTIEVEHQYCVLPVNHQGQGIVKKIFQISLQQYTNMGLKTINVHAGLNGGGHVWARHGFVAIDKDEVKAILDKARTRLNEADFKPVERIFDRYYTVSPNGKAFPMVLWANLDSMKYILRGSDWHGQLNLDNSEQFRNFMEYVFRK